MQSDMMPARATRIARAGPTAIEEAAGVLAAGGLAAFPTETVYGLGADATSDTAVARLFAAKERPSFNPLIVHVADLAAARRLAEFNEEALALAAAFWPGPLTLVLRRRENCPVGMLATAGLDTVAVRLPAHPVARDILAAFDKPVVAPSANRSGRVSPTTAQHVAADLAGRIDLIVDDGPSRIGVESTIVACLDGIALLRPGAIARRDLASVLGRDIAGAGADMVAELAAESGPGGATPDLPPGHPFGQHSRRPGPAAAPLAPVAPVAPGMLASHYAPRAAVRINAASVAPGEALLAFGPALPADAGNARAILNLSGGGLLAEAAANLFACLRRLDDTGAAVIAVAPIPPEGLGEAINDRLRRAAAPRGPRARERYHPPLEEDPKTEGRNAEYGPVGSVTSYPPPAFPRKINR
jgi:L-threonylcarbamoyladenylate synthase